MTEYIASSASVGLRPRMSRIRWYSSSLRPSSRYGCGCSGVVVALSTVSTAPVSPDVTPTVYRPWLSTPDRDQCTLCRCDRDAAGLLMFAARGRGGDRVIAQQGAQDD